MLWFLVFVLAFAAAVVVVYNRLVRFRLRCRSAWADVDAQLKRRWDLIPRLVETVRGYAAHERNLLEEVTRLRGDALLASSPARRGGVEGAVTSSLGSLLAVAERYPDLKASDVFARLHGSLVEVEEQLSHARRYYNAVVRDYNTAREVFPASIVASSFGFAPEEFFQLDAPEEASAPGVSLNS